MIRIQGRGEQCAILAYYLWIYQYVIGIVSLDIKEKDISYLKVDITQIALFMHAKLSMEKFIYSVNLVRRVLDFLHIEILLFVLRGKQPRDFSFSGLVIFIISKGVWDQAAILDFT